MANQLGGDACHIGSYSFTHHPRQANVPHLNTSQAGRYSIYLPKRDGRLSWPRTPQIIYWAVADPGFAKGGADHGERGPGAEPQVGVEAESFLYILTQKCGQKLRIQVKTAPMSELRCHDQP